MIIDNNVQLERVVKNVPPGRSIDLAAAQGPHLMYAGSGFERSCLVWKDAGTFSNVEILTSAYKYTTVFRQGVVLSAGGVRGNEIGYLFQIRPESYGDLYILKYTGDPTADLQELARCNFDMDSNVWYNIRVKRDDSLLPNDNLLFKVWRKLTPEPEEWSLTACDYSLGPGYVGYTANNNTSVFGDFEIVDVDSFSFIGLTSIPSSWEHIWDVDERHRSVYSTPVRWILGGVTGKDFFRPMGSANDMYWSGGNLLFSGGSVGNPVVFSSEILSTGVYPPVTRDSEILVKARTNSNSFTQIAVYLRIHPTSSYCYGMALRSGTHIRLFRYSTGFTIMQDYEYSWSINTDYWIRFQAVGSYLRGKVWEDGEPEPSSWFFTYQDFDLESGYIGFGYQNTTGIKTFYSVNLISEPSVYNVGLEKSLSLIGEVYDDFEIPVESRGFSFLKQDLSFFSNSFVAQTTNDHWTHSHLNPVGGDILLIGIHVRYASVSSINYGGVTPVHVAAYTGNTQRLYIYAIRKEDAPAEGSAHDLSVVFSGTGTRTGISSLTKFSGLKWEDIFTPSLWNNISTFSQSVSSTTLSRSINVSVPSILFDVVVHLNGNPGLVPGDGQTLLYLYNYDVNRWGAGSYRIATKPGTYTMNWSGPTSSSEFRQHVAVLPMPLVTLDDYTISEEGTFDIGKFNLDAHGIELDDGYYALGYARNAFSDGYMRFGTCFDSDFSVSNKSDRLLANNISESNQTLRFPSVSFDHSFSSERKAEKQEKYLQGGYDRDAFTLVPFSRLFEHEFLKIVEFFWKNFKALRRVPSLIVDPKRTVRRLAGPVESVFKTSRFPSEYTDFIGASYRIVNYVVDNYYRSKRTVYKFFVDKGQLVRRLAGPIIDKFKTARFPSIFTERSFKTLRLFSAVYFGSLKRVVYVFKVHEHSTVRRLAGGVTNKFSTTRRPSIFTEYISKTLRLFSFVGGFIGTRILLRLTEYNASVNRRLSSSFVDKFKVLRFPSIAFVWVGATFRRVGELCIDLINRVIFPPKE